MSLPLPEQPSRNRSSSTGDSGLPKHDHKRPRLSQSREDNQEILSMTPTASNEQLSSHPSHPSSVTTDLPESAHASPPKSPLPNIDTPDMTSPQSKVTINTRPMSSQSSTIHGQKDTSDGATGSTQADPTKIADSLDSTPSNQGNQDQPISISSSESGSPVIQVAVPEDLDRDPTDTQWEPIPQLSLPRRLSIHSGHVQRTFPFLNPASGNQPQGVVVQIAKLFQEGGTNDEEVFQKVKSWLVEFSENAVSLNYDFFQEDHDFWLRVPTILGGLMRRKVPLPMGLESEDLVALFVAYTRITNLVVAADIARLQTIFEIRDERAVFQSYSVPFLAPLHLIMAVDEAPLHDVMQQTMFMNPVFVVEKVMERLSRSYFAKHISDLTTLLQAMANLFQKRLSLIDTGMSIIMHATALINSTDLSDSSDAESEASHIMSAATLSASSQFLQTIDAILDRAITKQQPWLNIDTCEKAFKTVSSFIGVLASKSPDLASKCVQAANVDPSKFNHAALLTLASIAWRFNILHRCIKKGRMEIRVASVQTMASGLVEIYHSYIRSNPKEYDHPIVQFMVHFICENNMIRYIIGVDSHPQIIERSANIIGFLCVSRSYHNEDTDIIWQTILESQDSRAVVALLGAFQQNFDNLKFDILSYIVKKLLLLQFHRVDHHMLEFILRLLGTVDVKSAQEGLVSDYTLEVNECILKFCTKMLREAGTPENATTEYASRVRQQVQHALGSKVKQLRDTLQTGEAKELLASIFEELCNDIRTHNKFASGSALAFGIILQDADDEECSTVVQEHDLTSILVSDIVETCENSTDSASEESTWMDFENRLTLLIRLVYRTSHTVTDPLIKALWMHVLANASLNSQVRSMAWNSLGSVFGASRTRNSVLDILVDQYLPKLSPSLYDSAILQFVENSVHYQTKYTPVEASTLQDVVTIPGIERVWTIMLTAPPNTIETPATQFIIEQYLDNERIRKRGASVIEATHLSLIDRCVEQVIDAASQLTTGLNTTTDGTSTANFSESTNSKREHYVFRFYRSLLFLRKFLDTLKSRPGYTPAVEDNPRETLKSFETKGQTFEVTLQIIGHRTVANGQTKWNLGYDNTGHDVWQCLSDITGWSQFSVINGGRRMALKDDLKTLSDLDVKTGSLMINRVQGSPENTPSRTVRAASPVDRKVMHHFDALYSLLDLEDQLAGQVFDFLRMFSSQDKVIQRLKSMSIAPVDLLPVEKPFKLMYYAKALRSCLEEESYSSEPNIPFLEYGVRTILSVMPRLEMLKTDTATYISIAQGLVEALNLVFRAKVPSEVAKNYITDGVTFSKDILSLWNKSLAMSVSNPDISAASTLIRASFEALVEGILQDEVLWSKISLEDLKVCLESSFLAQSTREIRLGMVEVINALAGVMNAKTTIKGSSMRSPRMRFPIAIINNFLGHLWKVLVTLIPRANSGPAQCAEFFEALISIFRQYQQNLDNSELGYYIMEWKSLLLTHQHIQQVGLPSQDFFVSSLGKLLLQALKAAQQQQQLASDTSFVRDVFSTFLFPPLSDSLSFDAKIDPEMQQQNNPVLDMHTRWVLYEILIVLSSDRTNLESACEELSDDLLPRDFYMQPITNHDRQSLRSEVGYAGLRNLSNTCYLNSLLSQLFMNVEFRELVMNVNIIDHSNQKLLAELGKVFAYMQTSYEEAVDPGCAVESITQWDGEQIDVTVQMDVDEFFNLLFDRLESQIIDPKVCSAFKEIYGGQLVQQIKSKECEHVSERLEPFTAVQVEIKGKATLEESLRAYVEGEVLQGENKYSCTGCGKHVDAVKRACLKVVPNHLIFNLKRFDYDIMTGMRCKVNDEFGFPSTINMSPYTLEALSDPEKSPKTDIFELVGVIIHSGTAESGHYYSYVRQRPSSMPTEKSWIQFNDHDVSQFDPGSIRECCFGGIDYGAIQCPKFYNGYMLFYQRASSIRDIEQKYLDASSAAPVRLTLERSLETHISQHNELFLRSYVAQDPVHAKFIKSLLQQKATSDQLDCHQKHESTASKLLLVALNYLNQLSARWKELPEVDETLTLLRNYVHECPSCAQVILKWLTKDDNLTDNLTRSYYTVVRKGFASVIVTCWQKWSSILQEIQQNPEEPRSQAQVQQYLTTLTRFLAAMAEGKEYLQRYGRAWDTYFSVLQVIVRLGEREARLVVEAGFFELTLEFVHMHVFLSPIPKRLRVKYSNYLLQRERNRPFPHGILVQFLLELIQHVDLATPVSEYPDRATFEDQVSLLPVELSLLGLSGPNLNLVWMKKIILGRSNPQGADDLIKYLCSTERCNGLLCKMLKDGLAERNLLHATAFLQPTITFITSCIDRDLVLEVVEEALTLIETTSGQHARDFLLFIRTINSSINREASVMRADFTLQVKRLIPHWAPVLLMAPNDLHADIRGDTLDLLNEVLFQNMDNLQRADGQQYRQDASICKSLAKTCATYAETTFIQDRAPMLHAGQANQACTVVTHCLRFFGDSASDEEEQTRILGVMDEFKARVEGVIENVTENDWNGSSDLEAMSEVDNMSEASN